MAKRKKQSGDSLGAVYVFGYLILVTLAVIFIIATPLVLLGGSLYYKQKIKDKYSELKGNESDFWLTPEQKQRFLKVIGVVGDALNLIKKAKIHGNNEGVSKNKDGGFSRRSNLGKQLRKIIEANEQIINENKPEYLYLAHLPRARWNEFRNAVIRTQAFLYGFYAWILGAFVFISIYASSFLAGIKTFTYVGSLAMDDALTGGDWKMLLGTTAFGILGYFISFLLTQSIPESRTPIPPKVSPDNCNKF